MTVSVIIPTLNAESWIERQLNAFLNQSFEPEIIVVDSGSADRTVSIVKRFEDRVQILECRKDSFNHGKTRGWALRQSRGDFVVFFTQDALPKDSFCLENLHRALQETGAAAVYGRQTAYSDAPEYERLTREFNYPDKPKLVRENSIEEYGVKAFFFSNVCAMYRRDIYLSVGGFDETNTNEDMLMAAKLLHAEYTIVYNPEAVVYHSHNNSIRKDYLRNKEIGIFMERYREQLAAPKVYNEGLRLMRYVGSELIKEKRIDELFRFLIHASARFAGYQIGKRSVIRKGNQT